MLRARDGDRRLRFLFRAVLFSASEQGHRQFGAQPPFDHTIGTTNRSVETVLQHANGFIPLAAEPVRNAERDEADKARLWGGGFLAHLLSAARVCPRPRRIATTSKKCSPYWKERSSLPSAAKSSSRGEEIRSTSRQTHHIASVTKTRGRNER